METPAKEEKTLEYIYTKGSLYEARLATVYYPNYLAIIFTSSPRLRSAFYTAIVIYLFLFFIIVHDENPRAIGRNFQRGWYFLLQRRGLISLRKGRGQDLAVR